MVQKYDLPTKIQGSQFFFFIQLTVPNPLRPSVQHFKTTFLATKKSTYKLQLTPPRSLPLARSLNVLSHSLSNWLPPFSQRPIAAQFWRGRGRILYSWKKAHSTFFPKPPVSFIDQSVNGLTFCITKISSLSLRNPLLHIIKDPSVPSHLQHGSASSCQLDLLN